MEERVFNIENLPVKDRVDVAINQVGLITDKIAREMGEQWEIDRFGKYKSDHMIGEANESEEIIKGYGLDKKNELIKYLPLFKFICRAHDLGRHFHDDSRYMNEDGKFLDHGEISVRLLKEEGMMNFFSKDEWVIIEYSIRNHSLQEITKPVGDIEEMARVFCLVFRDIDKLEVLNKRDFVVSKEIYRLLGIHFDLGGYKDEWKNTDKRKEYIELVQRLLDGKDVEIINDFGLKIKEIVDKPLQENIDDLNLIELFGTNKSMSLDVFKKTNCYANYILFQLSLLNDIEYKKTLDNISWEEIQKKMNFLRSRTTSGQYNRIQKKMSDNFGIKVD